MKKLIDLTSERAQDCNGEFLKFDSLDLSCTSALFYV